jgi:hypothetical protein
VEEVEARVHLELGHVAEAERETEVREPVQIPFEAGERKTAAELEVDPGLEEDRAGRDRCRILGAEGPLLAAEGSRREETGDRDEREDRYSGGPRHGAAR